MNTFQRIAAIRPDTTEVEIYSVPADTQLIATITICNQTPASRAYRVAHTDAPGAAADEDWIMFDKEILPNDTHQISGITLNASETLRVKSDTSGAISFMVSGLKIET